MYTQGTPLCTVRCDARVRWGGMEAGWALTWACVCHCCRSVAGGGVRRRVLWRAAVGCSLPTCDHMRRLPSKVLTRVRSLCGVVWLLRCTPSSVPASCCACLRRCRYLASCSPSTRLTQLHSALRGWLCLGAHSVCVAWRRCSPLVGLWQDVRGSQPPTGVEHVRHTCESVCTAARQPCAAGLMVASGCARAGCGR